MTNAALLVVALGIVLAYILMRGFQYRTDEQLGSDYHLWSIRIDENEPSYLGHYPDEDEALQAAQTSLQDRKIEKVVVRNSKGISREFTKEALPFS